MSSSSRGSIRVVLRTGAALLALWAVSFGLSFLPLGAAAIPVALGVAAIKAVLVILFFMDLLHESASMKFAFLAGGVLLAVLIGLVIADIALREPPPLAPYGAFPDRPTADLPSR